MYINEYSFECNRIQYSFIVGNMTTITINDYDYNHDYTTMSIRNSENSFAFTPMDSFDMKRVLMSARILGHCCEYDYDYDYDYD